MTMHNLLLLVNFSKMVRVYKKKSKRAEYGSETMKKALKKLADGSSMRATSKEFGIPPRTLRRHRDGKVKVPGVINLGSYTVLPEDVEEELYNHIVYMENSLYGLRPSDVRRLAYELAEAKHLKHPFNKETKMAGEDWLRGFFQRFKELSIRSPTATNISRAVGFNRVKVNEFFDVYKHVLALHEFRASDVYNMDESGIQNVQKPQKICATKGARHVGKMTSGERGFTVTVICAFNGAGAYIPPMIIFPRVRMLPVLMRGAPVDAIGGVSKSGWTDANLFITWLKHFQKIVNASNENPKIIILDGHHSHKTLEAVTFCRANGIYLITLPPHCTHRMQPLDVNYFKSLKHNYTNQCDNWMTTHHGKRISQYEMAAIFGRAYIRASTPDKGVKGFEKCGIWPYNPEAFTEDDFLATKLTGQFIPANRFVYVLNPDLVFILHFTITQSSIHLSLNTDIEGTASSQDDDLTAPIEDEDLTARAQDEDLTVPTQDEDLIAPTLS